MDKQKNPSPVFWRGKEQKGVLLIHGFTGTPLEMMPLATFFHQLGYHVAAPMLAGHGISPQAVRKTTRNDWFDSVETAYHQLLNLGLKDIFVIGHSMGGLLAIKLADRYSLKAVASLSAPIFVRDQRIKYTRWLKYVWPYTKRKAPKPFHIERHIIPYPRTPLSSIYQLSLLIDEVKSLLPTVQTPTFIAQSGKDETVDPASADYIFQHIGSNYKKVICYPQSTHIITLDHDRDQLFEYFMQFLKDIPD